MNANSCFLSRTSFGLLFFASIFGLMLPKSTQAATITSLPGTPGSVAGITYEWLVKMGDRDSANFSRHVGAFSGNEPNNPVGLKGWTHTSNWVMLELAAPAKLTVKIERAIGVPNGTGIAGDNLYPTFSLYAGWDNNGEEDHQYNTLGNTDWADGISYLDHQGNGGTEAAVEKSFVLSAGLYSIAIGGDPPIGSTARREGYLATLSTTSVPEPETNGLLIVLMPLSYALLGTIGRRARK